MSQPYYIAQWDRRWIVGVLCCCLLLTFQPALYCCCLYQTSPTGPLLMSVCSRHAHASPNTDTHTCTRTVVDAFLHRAVFVCIKGKTLSWRAKLIFFLFLGSKQYKIYKINSPLTLCIEPHGGQSDMPHAKSTNQNIMSPYIELLGQLSCKNTKKYIDKNKKKYRNANKYSYTMSSLVHPQMLKYGGQIRICMSDRVDGSVLRHSRSACSILSTPASSELHDCPLNVGVMVTMRELSMVLITVPPARAAERLKLTFCTLSSVI